MTGISPSSRLPAMPKPRVIDCVTALGFVAVICSAGLIQAVLEARRGEWPQALELFRQKPTAANLRIYERNLEESSWVIKTLRPWMQYAQFILLREAGEKALVGRDGWLFYRPGLACLTGPPPKPSAGRAPESPLGAILDFRDQLDARGIHLVVVPAPNKESVYPDQLSPRADHGRGALGPETGQLLADLGTAGVEVVDLFAAFSEARRSGRSGAPPLYLAQDTHWSPAGVALAAQAVAQRLRQRGWAGRREMDYATRPAPVRRLGDLLRMLQVPPLEARAVPEEIEAVQIVRVGDGELYRDDPGSDLLVLGDSFLRVYQQDEPGGAGFIAHLGRELGRPVTSLVNDGGASTLVRQELFRRSALLRNKRVVIWEFVERDIRFGAEGWPRIPLPP